MCRQTSDGARILTRLTAANLLTESDLEVVTPQAAVTR
jgi:hypothetical protein